MKSVNSYPLQIISKQIVSVPFGSKLLSVDAQNNQVFLYALVDDLQTSKTNYQVLMCKTGQNIVENGYTYIGTIMVYEELILHIFAKRSLK